MKKEKDAQRGGRQKEKMLHGGWGMRERRSLRPKDSIAF